MKITKHPQYTLEFPEVTRQDPNYAREHRVPLKISIFDGKAGTPYNVSTLAEIREAISVLLEVQKALESDAESKPPTDLPF